MSGFYGSSYDYITDEVKGFLAQFRNNVASGMLKRISLSYQKFSELTEKTFKISAWPSVDSVRRTLNLDRKKDEMFILLYSELYYRHIFDRCETELEHMWNSFQNYINLFNHLLELNTPYPEIPDIWLWRMVNSFVSQFQYYQHWKNDTQNSDYLLEFQGKPEQARIQEKWTVQAVLRYLHALVMAGQIQLQYNPPVIMGDGSQGQGQQQQQRVANTMRMLGFFSLIGLLRMHCLVNDYRTAVKVLDLVDLRKKSAISKIEHCNISAHYYLSLSYLMTKRWVDCYNVCVSVLSRYQPMLKGDNLNIDDKIEKYRSQNEDLTDKDIYHELYLSSNAMLLRCYAFLSMTYILNNKAQRLDNLLLEQVNDMFNDDLSEMQTNNNTKFNNNKKKNKQKDKNDEKSKDNDKDNKNNKKDSKDNKDNKDEKKEENNNDSDSDLQENSSYERKKEAFQNLFFLGCPDYPNTFDLFVDTEAAQIPSINLKLNQFLKFFRLVNLNKSYEITRMRDELKLYRAIPTKKLAKQLEFDESNTFEKELIQLKSRMRQFKRVDGVSSNGEWSTQSDFDFFIKNNDVNVRRVDGTRLGRYTDTFVKNIRHMKELISQNSVM